MAQFIYDVLYQINVEGTLVWQLDSTGARVDELNLLNVLNHLGAQGWEVCAVGDFGNDVRHELLLKRRQR